MEFNLISFFFLSWSWHIGLIGWKFEGEFLICMIISLKKTSFNKPKII